VGHTAFLAARRCVCSPARFIWRRGRGGVGGAGRGGGYRLSAYAPSPCFLCVAAARRRARRARVGASPPPGGGGGGLGPFLGEPPLSRGSRRFCNR
jgi:hypothetical protein